MNVFLFRLVNTFKIVWYKPM